MRIVGEQSAGGVRLLPAGAGRPFVGLIDPGGAGQPLLSELFYADRALQPYASLQRGSIAELIDARAQAMILPDAGRVAPTRANSNTKPNIKEVEAFERCLRIAVVLLASVHRAWRARARHDTTSLS